MYMYVCMYVSVIIYYYIGNKLLQHLRYVYIRDEIFISH